MLLLTTKCERLAFGRHAALVVALALGACTVSSTLPTPPPTTIPIPRSVFLLMECFDCWSHELDSVVALGPAVVPVLTRLATLGPPSDRVTRLEITVAAALTDSALAPLPPLTPPDRAAIVQKQRTDYVVQYRARAAQALGAIGGPGAKAGLCAARLAGPPPLGVIAAVDAALASMGASCP